MFSGASDRFGGTITAVMYRPLVAEMCRWFGERARTAMLRALPAQISYRAGAVRRGQACMQPAAGRCLSAGERSFGESEQGEYRPGGPLAARGEMALDWASGAA